MGVFAATVKVEQCKLFDEGGMLVADVGDKLTTVYAFTCC